MEWGTSAGQGHAAFGHTQTIDGPTGPRANFGQRFGGSLIDGVIVVVVEIVLIALLKGPGVLLTWAASAAYYTYMEGGPRGQTFGKMAVGTRVISFETGGPIGYGRAFIRWIGHIVSSIPLGLGYFWMLWDKERQCWHDKFANDVVVPVAAYPVPQP